MPLNDGRSYASPVIPVLELWKLFPGIAAHDVVIGRMFPDEGSTVAFREMVPLTAIVRHERPQRIFEIGTSIGLTTYSLANNLPANGPLFTPDDWRRAPTECATQRQATGTAGAPLL